MSFVLQKISASRIFRKPEDQCSSIPSDTFSHAKMLLLEGHAMPPLVVIETLPSHHPSSEATYTVVGGIAWHAAWDQLRTEQQLGFHTPESALRCVVVPAGSPAHEAYSNRWPQAEVVDFGVLAASLRDAGESLEGIAAHFRNSVAFVGRAIAVSKVSPLLLRAYRAQQLTLEHLVAHTLTADHWEQERIFEQWPDADPWQIRRLLANTPVPVQKDARFAVVGQEGYATAGGIAYYPVDRPCELWVDNAGLLERLALERLNRRAADFMNDGWGWVECRTVMEFAQRARYEYAPQVARAMNDAEQVESARLKALREALDNEYDGIVGNDEMVDRQIAIEQARDALIQSIEAHESRLLAVPGRLRPFAGVIVTIGPNGSLDVLVGLVKPEDAARMRAFEALQRHGGTTGEHARATAAAELQSNLINHPAVAIRFLAHQLASQHFYGQSLALFGIAGDTGGLHGQDSLPLNSVRRREIAWRKQLPAHASDLWHWLQGEAESRVFELLAHCVALASGPVLSTPLYGKLTQALSSLDVIQLAAAELAERSETRPSPAPAAQDRGLRVGSGVVRHSNS